MTRPISAELFVSLDLVVEEPRDWHFPWVHELMLDEIAREQTTSTIILGRGTYESFAGSWPRRGDAPLAGQLNSMQKVVVSDTIAEAEATWGPVRILRPRGDLAGAIASLDDDGSDRMTVAGSVSLVEQLLALGLLTELRLLVHPLVVGQGRRLFDGWSGPRIELDHRESRLLDRGARLDVYVIPPTESEN